MANIRVDVNYAIKDGSEIVFRSPVDCSAITGLVVYYTTELGEAASMEFMLSDAHGHNVGDIDHLFSENVVVKVILDVTAGMAYVQNADTNAYIEKTFVKTVNGATPDKNGNVNVEGGAGVFVGDENTTLAEFFEAFQNKKACFLYRPRGGTGYEQWVLYTANTSQARFYMIDANGNIMVGTLKSNGDWSYVVHEVGGSVSEEQIVSVLESYLEEHPIEGGNDGFSPTVSVSKSGKVTTVSITDKNGTKTATINDGADGSNGKDGTSVTVKSVSESTADGGSNVVTFSDGKTVTIKNGSKGSTGSNGSNGVSATHSWSGTTLTVTSASGTSSANLKGEKGDKGDSVKGDKGDTGATGQRGTGLLAVTTAPASYTTAVGGITPKYRMAISTIKTQAGVTEVLLGDTVRYSYYHYPIAYLDASYAYMTTRVSIRGATGAAGKDYTFDPTAYGVPILYLTGDTEGMSKDVKKTLDYSCTDAAGNAHTGTCTVKWQGNTSVNYEKKNYTIKFDSAFEACSGWGAQEKYCFKANFTDHSHCRNVVSAKLWGKIRKNRSGLDSKLKALPNAGAIDGFPAIIMLNGEFHGLYTWNIPKDQWMFNMGSGTQEAILMAHGPCDQVRFKAPALVDEEDYEMEFVTDEDNSAWVATSVNQLINACINSWGGDLDTAIAPYLDWESAIDYYIFTVLIDGRDIMEKNFILATYNGTKWFFSAYDLDSNYGMRWNATQTYRPDDTAGDSATFENFANKHRLFELIKRFKTDELKARYASLRKTVLHELALAEMFENFAWSIPSPVLVEDVKLYPSIRGSAVNNVDQILRWLHHRLSIVDGWINALPAQEEPVNPLGYTNQVPLSKDTDGSVFNGTGYQDGLRLSSSGATKTAEFSTVTGYIPVKPGDVIRVVGVEWYSDSGNYVCTYDSSFNFLGNLYDTFKSSSANGTFNVNASSKLNESDALITLGTSLTNSEACDNIAYIRVSSQGLSASRNNGIQQTGANMIVTVNEEIT